MDPHSASSDSSHHDRRPPRRAGSKTKNILALLGPGLITGASDDDPSGIATYSQTGARFGYAMLWAMLLTVPLMAAIQEIAARIGRVTGRGLARNMRLNYSPWIVFPIVTILFVANIINLGADIGAMGDAARLVTGGPSWLSLVYAITLTVGSLLAQIFWSYKNYMNTLKYLTAALLVYVITGFIVHVPWHTALFYTLVPHIQFHADYIALLVGVLGTTISPYLFFWQASLESDHVKMTPGKQALKKAPDQSRHALWRIRVDTWVGIVFSNIVSFFIILSAAATLHANPNPKFHDVTSAAQAAAVLKPLAGNFASTLFAIGILSGGLLAIPSLAGSAAYAIGELFRLPVGLEQAPHRAKFFYTVLIIATLLGLAVVLSPLSPMKALVWAAILNGLADVPVMVIVMLLFSTRKIMGPFSRTSRALHVVGWLATAAMTAAAVGFFATLKITG